MLLEIRVRPNSSRNKVGGLIGDCLIVAVQAPAVDGKANDAVLKELAKAFDVRTRDITIVHGELARDKRVVIDGDEKYEISAPYIYNTAAGTQKLGLALNDCVFVTMHSVEATTTEEAEKELFVETRSEEHTSELQSH